MDLSKLVDRKHEIRTREQSTQAVKQRMATAAEELSRAGDAATHVELFNEALCRFVPILYQKEMDGIWAHIDRRTHRILPGKPWGSAGWKRWGLRQWEAKTLSSILMARVLVASPAPLFDYSLATHDWYLNVDKYRSVAIAVSYLEQQPITLAEWRKYRKTYVKA